MSYFRAQLIDGQLAVLQIDDAVLELLPVLSTEATITTDGVAPPSWAVSLDRLDTVLQAARWHRFSGWVERDGMPTCMVRRPDLYEHWSNHTTL